MYTFNANGFVDDFGGFEVVRAFCMNKHWAFDGFKW
jgi:hypothetical protein